MTAKLATMQAELALQDRLLPGVSRTFALTIPELPGMLRTAVTNAYLLCRIADTIEDDPRLDVDRKTAFHADFVAVVEGDLEAADLVRRLAPVLEGSTPPEEVELVRELPAIIRVTEALPELSRRALRRCIRVMCQGMPGFQRETSVRGLPSVEDLERYCYYVAGCVGEMLTELFCEHNGQVSTRRSELMRLAVSFGQGLQMTNILKDFWEDRTRAACWLPRSVFEAEGMDLADAEAPHNRQRFSQAMTRLVAIAHACLRDAIDYVKLIPRSETGIRRFCLWAIGLAVLTLRNIRNRPDYMTGADVKVSRRMLKATVLSANAVARSNSGVTALFELAAAGLPLDDEYAARLTRELERETLPAGTVDG